LVGRLLLGGLFLHAGVMKAMAPAVAQAQFARMGITAVHLVYTAALVIEIAGAACVILGWKARAAAAVMALWALGLAGLGYAWPITGKPDLVALLPKLAIAGG
jgi:putative oxidoreductase